MSIFLYLFMKLVKVTVPFIHWPLIIYLCDCLWIQCRFGTVILTHKRDGLCATLTNNMLTVQCLLCCQLDIILFKKVFPHMVPYKHYVMSESLEWFYVVNAFVMTTTLCVISHSWIYYSCLVQSGLIQEWRVCSKTKTIYRGNIIAL